MVASVFKKVVAEILMYMDGQVSAYDELKKKKPNKYKIGGK